MSEPHILLVEDNPFSRRTIRDILERANYAVAEAHNASSALERIRSHPPELILQDMMLPDMDGVELTHRIRELPGGREIPVVILSGFVSRMFETRTIEARYSAWLVKPIDAEQLLETVRLHLQRAEAKEVGRGLHVLIIDDDPVQLKLQRLHFTQLGFEVSTATSGAQALEQLDRKPIHVVLSDVLMPDIDGFELCLAIRRNPKFRNIPVVLVSSSYQMERDRALALQAGANALLTRTPGFDGIEQALIEAVEQGPPATPAESEREAIDEQHLLALRRQLDLQIKLNVALARRSAMQATQLALLGGMAEALSRDADIDVALNELLAASLDAAGISRGILYLKNHEGLRVRSSVGYGKDQEQILSAFFGHRALLDAAIASKAPSKISSTMLLSAAQRDLLATSGMLSIFVVPLVHQEQTMGALVLGSDVTDVTSEEPVVFARAIGAHIIKSLQLHRAFERTAFSEARYAGLVANATCAVLTLRPDGVITSANAVAEGIFGEARERLVGRRCFDFVAPSDRDYALLRFSDRVNGGATGIEVQLQQPGGKLVTVNFSSVMIDAGGERVVLSIATDVTERNRLRQQAWLNDKLATVGTLAAGIAHEINNPTAFVLANLTALQDQLGRLRTVAERLHVLRQETDAQRRLALLEHLVESDVDLDAVLVEADEAVRESIAGGERIRDIVKGMKGFARVDDAEMVTVDINQVIATALKLTSHEVRQRAQLVTDLGRDVGPVAGSRGKLQQVIINLVVNAAQAIEAGNPASHRLTVRSRREEDRIRITVADTGKGIPPEHLPRIFDPFFTTKPVGVGTGLGLSISYEIVRQHGGEMRVDSVVGRGTTFTVDLPLQSGVLPLVEPPPPSTSVAVAARRARVLIVDDEEFLLHAIRRMLRHRHEVMTALGGRAGIDACKSAQPPFDVIISDLSMPEVSGMDLHRFIAQALPGMERRMVFMTGGAFTPQAAEFLQQLDNPRLQKPFRPEELDQAILAALARTG